MIEPSERAFRENERLAKYILAATVADRFGMTPADVFEHFAEDMGKVSAVWIVAAWQLKEVLDRSIERAAAEKFRKSRESGAVQ